MIEEYRQCAAICEQTNYADKKSVRQHNRAANKMYKLITSAAQQGADSISAFFPLLDEPTSAKWLAHQLLEKTQVDTQVEEKCLKIIEALAKGDGPDALGEKWWLRDYKAKKK